MKDLKESIQKLEKQADTMITIDDADKDAKKLLNKVDELLNNVKESMRRDKNDVLGKITSFKTEFEPRIFDKETYNFLKDKVRQNWNSHMKRTNELEN